MTPDAVEGMNLFIKSQIETQMQSYQAEQDKKIGKVQSEVLALTYKNTELGQIIEENNKLMLSLQKEKNRHTKNVITQVVKLIVKVGGRQIAFEVTKIVSLDLAKTASKTAGKCFPLLGIAMGGILAYSRYADGQYEKAFGELASGAFCAVPVVGPILSVAIDLIMSSHDIYEYNKVPTNVQVKPIVIEQKLDLAAAYKALNIDITKGQPTREQVKKNFKLITKINADHLANTEEYNAASYGDLQLYVLECKKLIYKENGWDKSIAKVVNIGHVSPIEAYLKNPTEEAKLSLQIQGILPIHLEEEVSDEVLSQFEAAIDNLGCKEIIKSQYPGVFKQILKKKMKNDQLKKPQTSYQKYLVELQKRVHGQMAALEIVANALSTQESGNLSNHCFLFVGPTGTGKTALGEAIGLIKKQFILFSMNQYPSEADVSRFFGASIGYMGSNSKSDFANELDKCKPTRSNLDDGSIIYTIQDIAILFDELEKAHMKTRQSLLSLFDRGIVDISYTENDKHKSTNLKIQYQFKNCVIISTSNLYQNEILNAFEMKKTGEIIAKNYIELNKKNPGGYSQEFLNRVRVVPFGPIEKGLVFQNLLKSKIEKFLESFKSTHKCREVVIEEELFYETFEKIIYGNGIGMRRILEFFSKIDLVVNKHKSYYGDICNKKFIFFADEKAIYYKLLMYIDSLDEYTEYFLDFNSKPLQFIQISV